MALFLVSVVASALAAPVAPPVEPARYAGQWLVILSSRLDADFSPPALDTLRRATGLSTAPVRLDSTRYKNLMPCYDVVVAQAFAKKDEAKTYSATLTGLGIDHYLKQAGDYVPQRPELAATCAAMRTPPAAPEGYWFLDEVGLALPLPSDQEAAALAAASPLLPHGSSDVWMGPMSSTAVGEWARGQSLLGVGPAGVESCAVSSFAAGVVGTPHFGVTQNGPLTQPACGEAAAYARLDCADARLAMPAGSKPVAYVANPAAKAPAWYKAREQRFRDGLRPIREEAARVAKESDTKVAETWTLSAWTRPDQPAAQGTLWMVSVSVLTGEGYWYCGGGDYFGRATWVLDSQGSVLLGPDGFLDEEVELVADLDADGKPEVLLREGITGRPRLWSATLEREGARAYCDCPC